MASARRVEPGFSPLDRELGLHAGSLTPSVLEHVVRLGAQLPFGRAAQEAEAFRRVSISRSTVRRHTLSAGAALVGSSERERDRLEEEAPEAPAGPERLVMSVDGAMVPLVGGEWAEVKTLAVGEVKGKGEDGTVQTGDWSYFSRLSNAETFERQALVETDRRGVATAGAVAAVTDGAEWIQGFIDCHRPDAVRVLDFAHAAQRVSAVCEALGEGEEQRGQRLSRLKAEGPGALLAGVRQVVESGTPAGTAPGDGGGGTVAAALKESWTYLRKREAQMQYPAFREAGWPIGSGSVESANKLVVEARLKGSGMHWKRENVNPLLALRSALCSDRWGSAWSEVMEGIRMRTARLPSPPPPPEVSPPLPTETEPAPLPTPPLRSRSGSPHPWRRFSPAGPRFSYFSSKPNQISAKL